MQVYDDILGVEQYEEMLREICQRVDAEIGVCQAMIRFPRPRIRAVRPVTESAKSAGSTMPLRRGCLHSGTAEQITLAGNVG
jgi:hypothetical protein